MTIYETIEKALTKAKVGNSKARQAKICLDMAKEFKAILSREDILELLNEARKILSEEDGVLCGVEEKPLTLKEVVQNINEKEGLLGRLGFTGIPVKITLG